MKWVKAAKGIRYREHPSRRYGNHLDRYYSLYYKVDGKLVTEGLGWESENREPGRSMLQRAEEAMAQIRQNIRTGGGPVTKKERIEVARIKKAEEQKKRQQEELKNITLDEFFEKHFKPFAERNLKFKSCQTELGHYTVWMKDILGSVPVKNINSMTWDTLLAKIFKNQLSERTRRYICGTLCRILKLAKERGYEVEIPSMKKLGLPQQENRRERVISQEELSDILSMLIELNINAYRITIFAFYTGCRFSEAASLKWSEVREDCIIFRKTKNKTTRQIPLPAPVKELLDQINPRMSDYVFTNDSNEPYKEPPSSFKCVVDKLGLNEGKDEYNKITFHSLRHTAATHMAKYLDVRSLMDIFGWKCISMAVRYLHGNEDQKKSAMDSLSAYTEEPRSASIIQFNSSNGY